MLYTASILAFVALAAMIAFYYRQRILSLFPTSSPVHAGYSRLATFSAQAANGLSSRNFDIEESNLEAGDSRTGLDEAGVEKYMLSWRNRVSHSTKPGWFVISGFFNRTTLTHRLACRWTQKRSPASKQRNYPSFAPFLRIHLLYTIYLRTVPHRVNSNLQSIVIHIGRMRVLSREKDKG